jgi:hypothetical protein
MNLHQSIKKILKETLEARWNDGDYDYQKGFCHYFAYNIIDKIRERFPDKEINYLLLLASEIDTHTNEVEQEYLLHVYIKIDDLLLDSNGFTTYDKAIERAEDWEERQLSMTPDDYEIELRDEESYVIPEFFFNNSFCNAKRVKQDVEKFLSNAIVQRILRDK